MRKDVPSCQNTWTDSDVEVHWDTVADIYVAENNRVKDVHDQRFRYAVSRLKLDEQAIVLNISSRDAEAAEYIRMVEPSVEVVNAEISAGLMRVAHTLRPWIKQVKIESYSRLPFPDGFFSRILTLETLEHVENPLLFLMELHRVSIPNATMVLSCPPATSEIPYRIYTFLFGGHGEGPHRFPASREVKKLLQNSGWQLEEHRGTLLVPVGPPWLKNIGEVIINRFQNCFISELGIRQFYVCRKI